MENNIRYIARIIIEADSALAVNSGDKSLLLDNQIARDANGLPYLPGTSIAGIIRHAWQEKFTALDDLFGGSGDTNSGSRLIFSSGHLVGDDGLTIIDGLTPFDRKGLYYEKMMLLPQRDHVRMTDRGAADVQGHGKFDREQVYKGTRFCFEIELIGNDEYQEDFEKVLAFLGDKTVRIGAGTRKGSGAFKVLSDQSFYWKLDLKDENDLEDYLNKSSNLNNMISKKGNPISVAPDISSAWEEQIIELTAEGFFLFGSSLADADADNTPKTETVLSWENGKPVFQNMYLFPASSIKGALSHRAAYHYNLQTGEFIGGQKPIEAKDFDWHPEAALEQIFMLPDTSEWAPNDTRWEIHKQHIENLDFDVFLKDSKEWKTFVDKSRKYGSSAVPQPIMENNPAVAALFGEASENKQKKGQTGKVIIDDIYCDKNTFSDKVFNHVKIDRFTGGAWGGALFQEKALTGNETIIIRMLVKKGIKPEYIKALEAAINDLKSGQLALGGATSKGYGMFTSKS